MNKDLEKAVYYAKDLALEKFPDEKGRITRGLNLVLKGNVTLHNLQGEIIASVLSDTGRQTYIVRKEACSCVDHNSKAPERRCKHRYAVWLIRKALKIMQQSHYVDPVNGVCCGNVLLSNLQKAIDGNIIDKVCSRY